MAHADETEKFHGRPGLLGVPLPTRSREGRWDLTQATELQARWRKRVESEDRLGPIQIVAGADVSYARGDPVLYASVVSLDAASLELLETAGVVRPAEFPYLPGYLSFREAPAVIEAFSSLRRRPDLLLVDGHGLAHPRGFGLACHLGLILDRPTIGVAKSILIGQAREPGRSRGSSSALRHKGRTVGRAVRTRQGIKPVYVSIGHRVSLSTAVRLALSCTGRFRIPEPTRLAHHAVNRLRAGSS